MSNSFRDSIRVDNEEKIKSIREIIQTMLNSTSVLTFDEMRQRRDDKNSKLNEDEILASYYLGLEVKKAIQRSKVTQEIMELIGGEDLVEFIEKTVEDIKTTKSRNPDIEYSLSIGKIVKRIEARKALNAPTKEYVLKTPKKDKREKEEKEKNSGNEGR